MFGRGHRGYACVLSSCVFTVFTLKSFLSCHHTPPHIQPPALARAPRLSSRMAPKQHIALNHLEKPELFLAPAAAEAAWWSFRGTTASKSSNHQLWQTVV